MLVQEFIREKGWDALTSELFIEVKVYPNGLRKLNYNQIDSPKMHPVVQECRALILDADGNVVSRAFPRFFNYGEADTKDFNFSDCTVWEKADGSLISVYWNPMDTRWEIATRGTCFAESNHMFDQDKSFRHYVLKAFGFDDETHFQNFFAGLSRSMTYVFEYTDPLNRIVTRYTESKMVLLGIFENSSGVEFDITRWFQWFKYINVRLPNVYHASSGDEVVKMCEDLTDLAEGFVCVEKDTNRRVKVKNSHYVIVHQLKGNGTPTQNNLMELVLRNEQDEFLSYFPEFKSYVDPVENALYNLLRDAENGMSSYCHLETQKDFALAVKELLVAPILFKARKDGLPVRQVFHAMDMNQQKRILEKYVG